MRALNASLQERIDDALAEVAALVERNALLREELSQQERLAVAGQLTAAFAHEVGAPSTSSTVTSSSCSASPS